MIQSGTYQFAFADAVKAKQLLAGYFLASDEVVLTLRPFALVTVIESEMTRSLSIFSLRSIFLVLTLR
jgi:hypothetical protein